MRRARRARRRRRRVSGRGRETKPEDAPSNLAVVGRYLFTPRIFEFLEDAQPGVGGEIQLTDAMDKLLAVEPMHGLIFESGRYDIGQKIDFCGPRSR